MEERQKFLVPDYYPDFHCKMGACRSACCEGWPISLSMKDYFTLLSVECSPETRRKLDCAMHLAEHPMPEAYAHILPRYDGACPMRMEDGRCALHAEVGEHILAPVCRLYPRGVRTGEVYECSCANSCEAVLEMFIERKAPIAFEDMTLDIQPPKENLRTHHFEHGGRQQKLRLWLIGLVQDRRYPIAGRLVMVGDAIQEMDSAMRTGNWQKIEELIDGRKRLPEYEKPVTGPGDLCIGLGIAERMLDFMDQRSDSVRKYGEAALEYFEETDGAYERYVSACEGFESVMPDWEIWFEHMLVNHMFFSQFPFQDRPVDVKDEFLGLCTVYMLLRFLCVGWTALKGNRQAAVDAAAAAFRLIDHTEFDRYAAPALKELGHNNWSEMHEILCL
ncbi:MAG: hypothetical protein E7337_13330 [Clostridiales bacterium]|nr:hypothetical protein [Clostridiales bacterium]